MTDEGSSHGFDLPVFFPEFQPVLPVHHHKGLLPGVANDGYRDAARMAGGGFHRLLECSPGACSLLGFDFKPKAINPVHVRDLIRGAGLANASAHLDAIRRALVQLSGRLPLSCRSLYST